MLSPFQCTNYPQCELVQYQSSRNGRFAEEIPMRSDSDIKRDVEDELRWDPDIDATDIAVAVKSGVVTLAGFTRSYSDKLEAEVAAKRVAGVVGLANDIEGRLPSIDK